MRRTLAIAGSTAGLALTLAPAAGARAPGCHKLYAPRMAERAARATYAGTRTVTLPEFRRLGWYERCQRTARGQAIARAYDRAQRRQHYLRVHPPVPPLSYATASWYDDAGSTASGYHAGYGIAHLTLPFGTRVLICYAGRCVDTIVDDRGPYVGGRTFDLNQNVAGALGFSGVGTVGYAIGR